ncbi:hypothetical protein [Formosa algae]|uniref:Uncharacterized protein n=1 Tax=Formosa algae TaxID=225843 RepID=A0A9X1C8Y3_9FLAO|nr:hypothetical protein [Formosa algae]MBP1839313.1 hypothetical protein [Formosa algae]MDQ0334090.1 hypothetical protein [Formosa algae]OEI79416.1 hypothetical protein AST99_14480 [Formosa algae]
MTHIKWLCFSLLFVCLLSCKEEQKNLPEDFDFGEVKDHTYTNSYFGLSFDYPKDWSQQSKHDIKAITDKGEKYLARENTKMGSILKVSQINTAYLFSLFKYPLKSTQDYNASLSVIAENIAGSPDVKRGRDYLFNSKELLKQTPAQYQFEEQLDTENLGGETFDILKAKATYGPYKVQQEFYCIVRYGFSLSFILSYTNDEEKAVLHDILDTVTLE